MKLVHSLIVFASTLFIGTPASSQNNAADLHLPRVHKIMHATLSPSYSCRSEEQFRTGYANTALFLSDYSRQRNSPELLFNGACNSADYFAGQTAGDDLDVITDYGQVALTDLVPQQVFSIKRTTDSAASFAQTSNVQLGHTYGVLINKSDIRGFFYVRVTSYAANRSVELEYVVMDYQILRVEAKSPGFNWDEESSH